MRPAGGIALASFPNTGAAARIVKKLSTFPPNHLEDWRILEGERGRVLENADWWKPPTAIISTNISSFCLMIVPNAEKSEARRSGQKDGGGESAANRSRNAEEVLFLMDPVQC